MPTNEQIRSLARIAAARAQIERLIDPVGDDAMREAVLSTLAKMDALARLTESGTPPPKQDPDETQEGLERLDLRDALERIAYPKNWPSDPEYYGRIDLWMQAVAANALTNAGTYNYERKAKP